MLNNQSHDKRQQLTSGLRRDVTECKAPKRCDLSGLQTAGADWPQRHTSWLSSKFSVNEEVDITQCCEY